MVILLKRISSILERINKIAWHFSVVLLLTMTVTVLLQIVMRKLFNHPISWIEEFCAYAMFVSSFLMAPYLVFHRLNINMTLFYDKIRSFRLKAFLNAVLHVLRFVSIVALLPFILKNVESNWFTATTQMPFTRGQLYTLVVYSFVMMLIVIILQFLEDIFDIYSNKETIWIEL